LPEAKAKEKDWKGRRRTTTAVVGLKNRHRRKSDPVRPRYHHRPGRLPPPPAAASPPRPSQSSASTGPPPLRPSLECPPPPECSPRGRTCTPTLSLLLAGGSLHPRQHLLHRCSLAVAAALPSWLVAVVAQRRRRHQDGEGHGVR
jgi:hypothetical protein